MRQLVFLGTAAGMPFRSNSSAILVDDDDTQLLFDTSGGYTIFRAFHDAGKNARDITHIFISHYDADHILGIVPLVRLFSSDDNERTIFCSQTTKNAIDAIFTCTASRHLEKVKDRLHFAIISDGESVEFNGHTLTAFDVKSSKTPQLGCVVQFTDEKRVVFVGDEPLDPRCLPFARDADILVHEAFCTSDQVDHFKPYEKQHGTAKDAGGRAVEARAKTLALFHMEDETLETRKQSYLADVRAGGYADNVFVPIDGDTLQF